MKRMVGFLAILCLMNVSGLLAQATTPEATPEAPPRLSDIFASLPQLRTEDGAFVVGEPDAPITIIDFTDFACVHCQDYRPTLDQIITDFVATGQAKFELRIFPTAGGEVTYFVGRLLECAAHQRAGAFWEGYELLYSYALNGDYDENVGRQLARDLDLNYSKLLTCVPDADQVETDMAFARDNGVGGTPGIMVRYGDDNPEFVRLNGQTYDRGGVPYEILEQTILAAHEPSGLAV
jgi:protein-disulfide isomerase